MDLTTLSMIALVPALGILANTIAGFARQNGWPQEVNTCIAWAFTLAATFGDAFLNGKLTTNIPQDYNVLLAIGTALVSTTLHPLSIWLQPRVLNVKKAALTKPTTAVVPTVHTWGNATKQDIGG